MANPQTTSLVFETGDPDGIAQSQALAAAGNLTLNGALVSGGVATFDAARRVGIGSGGDDTGITFTIYGTDRYGNTQSEVLAGKNAAIAISALDYLSVTRIAASGAVATVVEAGTTDTGTIGSGPWIPTNIYVTQFQLDIFATVAAASASTYSIEVTPDDPNLMAPPGGTASNLATAQTAVPPQPGSGSSAPYSFSPPQAWAAPAALTNKSANAHALLDGVPFAWRLTILSGTTRVTAQGIQAGIDN